MQDERPESTLVLSNELRLRRRRRRRRFLTYCFGDGERTRPKEEETQRKRRGLRRETDRRTARAALRDARDE